MKKLVLVLFIGIFLVGVVSIVSAETPIRNCIELQNIDNDLSEDYYLVNDIYCSDTVNWNRGTGFLPIANYKGLFPVSKFEGTFDGRNFTISDIFINYTATSSHGGVGLFAYLGSSGKIKDLNLINAFIGVKGPMYGAVLVANSYGEIINSHAKGNLYTYNAGSNGHLGGLVGYNAEGGVQGNAVILHSSFEGFVDFTEGFFGAGGLVASNGGKIGYSYSKGTVVTDSFAGGLVERNSGEICASYSDVFVNGGSDASTIGGLVGINTGKISYSYAKGDVSGNSAGGLVGDHRSSSAILQSYATGNVNVVNSGGGLIAGSGPCDGIIDSFWDKETSGVLPINCFVNMGKTTNEMKDSSTYTNWDFSTVWRIGPLVNDGYPVIIPGGYECFSDCPPDDIIMKLSGESNSHGAFWNDNNGYDVEICYNDIFGEPYTVPLGVDSHACTGTNRVLSLYSTSNSHAARDHDDTYYNDDVCYGDLSCYYDTTSGDSCGSGGEVVARAYSGTNSHLAVASDSSYSTKVCCNVGLGQDIYWAYADGKKIIKGSTKAPNIGDTIQAVVTNMGAGTFNILEDDVECILGLPLGCGDDVITSIVGNGSTGNLIGMWKITQADLLITDGDFEEFYFNVNGGDNESDRIAINGTYDDSPMNVTIITPECADNYSQGADVLINVTAKDEDDVINGTVSIGGVVKKTFTNGGVDFYYNFTSAGNVQIVAEGVNSRGRARHISNIMIIGSGNGEYLAACIDKPKDFTDIDESVVEFDASTTKAIVVSGGSRTSFSPETDSAYFSWYWKFRYDDKIHDDLGYRFTAEFPVAGDNSASLRVEFEQF